MKKPRWNEIFRWVRVGEVPPYIPIVFGYIIAPMSLIAAIRDGEGIYAILFWGMIMVLNMVFAQEPIKKAFFYNEGDNKHE